MYDHRQLHNAALEHRRTAYRKAGATIRYGDQPAELKHIRADDPDGGRVKTISVERKGNRWFVVLPCDDVPAEPLPATGAAAGIDLGAACLVTTGDGTHVADPRHLAATAASRGRPTRPGPQETRLGAAAQGGRPRGRAARRSPPPAPRPRAQDRQRAGGRRLRRDRAGKPADREHDQLGVRHDRPARPGRRRQVRPEADASPRLRRDQCWRIIHPRFRSDG
ncbi:hypothetical protein Acsp04_59890 [Actinomadura sp. NBRC 104425]|nr:hypothetical protein Acsp04_59890 [Actinomadura sp. NBRC 104425]